MNAAALLAELPGLAFAFVLLLARLGGAAMLLPGMAESEVPMMARAGLALALTLLLLPLLAPALPREPQGAIALAVLLAGEILIGAWLGWLARLVAWAAGMAGQFIAFLLGLSSILLPDPSLGGQSSALERLFNLSAVLILLGTGLYALPLQALKGSYDLLPPGNPVPLAEGMPGIVGAMADSFALALRLAAPFVLLGTLYQFALGLLSRLVPRLQVYFIAMPGQILGGFLLLALLAAPMLAVWRDAAEQTLGSLPGLP